MRDSFQQALGGRMAVTGILHSSKRQLHLGSDRRQVNVSETVVVMIANISPLTVVLGTDRHRKAVIGIVVNFDRLLDAFDRNQSDVRAESLLTQAKGSRTIVHS